MEIKLYSQNVDNVYFFALCEKKENCTKVDGLDQIFFTYDDSTNKYNYPNSTWTYCRNKMFELILEKYYDEQRLNYYCLIDGDLGYHFIFKDFIEKIKAEREYRKIIVLNNHECSIYSNDGVDYYYWYDTNFNCFNTLNIKEYLPYYEKCDNISWFLPCIEFVWRANIYENFPFKIYHKFKTTNNKHGTYPKSWDLDCLKKHDIHSHGDCKFGRDIGNIEECTYDGKKMFGSKSSYKVKNDFWCAGDRGISELNEKDKSRWNINRTKTIFEIRNDLYGAGKW